MFLDAIAGIIRESLKLLLEMSPYLLFGFAFAGLLHVFVSLGAIARHLGSRNIASVIKSVILGIPLPLCSCGVIPAAISLKKKGASKGSVISFLIATPITGIDSILATYSLLGPLFTIYRILSASITALIAGFLTNWWAPHAKHVHAEGVEFDESCKACHDEHEAMEHVDFRGNRVREYFRYTVFELLDDIWKWLVIGILIGGLISYLIPADFINRYLGAGWQAMLIMLVVGIPMYVCATGSIPIAAALMMKGMSPGAALVFLLAGPATNAVTVTVVSKELGKAATAIYVISIAIMSVLFGMLFNKAWSYFNLAAPQILKPMTMLPLWLKWSSAALLIGLIILIVFKRMIGSKGHVH